MKVISGKYKGRVLKGFDLTGTRPTMDRVKESLFGTIQNYIPNSVVLDLFAGSGSLGIESLSNGSKACYFIDNNNQLIDVLKKNTANFDEEIVILKKDYIDALIYFKDNDIRFDIIFLDPPYKMNLIDKSISLIQKYNLLKKDGILVCEFEREIFHSDYKLIKDKKYGSKYIRIYINDFN